MLKTITQYFTPVLFFLFFSIQSNSQIHMPVFPDLEGDSLLTELVNEFTTSTVLISSQARDTLYGVIDNFNDTVTGIYSGHALHLPPGVDPSIHLFMNGSLNGINLEHSYPRSKGADEDDGNGNGFTDLHHLFPTRVAVNFARGNSPFLEIPDNLTTSWFYLNQEQSTIPVIDTAFFSERTNNAFEPREEVKGNIARAIFYFFTIYNDNALAADSTFFAMQQETLCDWHVQDPIDSLEQVRTFLIAGFQDSIPNPFILDSTLAHRTFCDPLPVALPVTLSYFKVSEKNKWVELNWQTISELNNHGFEIERRSDDRPWETLQFINGNGTTRLVQNYSFIDEKPLRGINYYRLKQIDFDGKFEYSNIRSVNIIGGDQGFVEIYPNPNTGIFKINLFPINNQEIHLRLFDNLGKKIWEKNFADAELTQSWERDFDLSLPGMYILVAEMGGEIQTHKIIVGE